jgi:hypothetical protein
MKKISYMNLILLFVVLFTIMYIIESVVNKYAYTKGKSINKVVLPDIIQDNIKKIQHLDVISDLFTSSISFIFFTIFILNGQYKYIIIFIFIFLIFRFIGYIYFVSTTLPDSSKECKYSSNFFKNAMNMGSCNNLGISIHFFGVIIQILLIARYYGSSYWLLYIAVYICAFILICASRSHYTIDCVTSTFIALVFNYEIDNIQRLLNHVVGKNYFNI